MDRNQVREIHYIAHLDNLASILTRGILNHADAAKLRHVSIAMKEVQDRRAQKVVPNGQRLHLYANLYFSARNPMMYARKEKHAEICVLRVSPNVLDIPGAIVTDGNAGSDYTAFFPSPEGLDHLDSELVFARSWWHEDEIEWWNRKRVRCAEVLIPGRVPPEYITGAYLSCEAARIRYAACKVPWATAINPDLFFRR